MTLSSVLEESQNKTTREISWFYFESVGNFSLLEREGEYHTDNNKNGNNDPNPLYNHLSSFMK